MSTEANKDIVRRYQDALNRGDLEALDELLAADFETPTMLPGLPTGREGARLIHKMTLDGIPDWHTTIEELIAEGDQVVARITMTGTHTGTFFGIPASGNAIRFPGVYIATVRDGKIGRHWGVEDTYLLMQQLGVVPAMG